MEMGSCLHDIITQEKSFLAKLEQKACEKRIPLTGSIELTHRCNLKCRHCYLGSQHTIAQKAPRPELATKTWLKLIDDFTREGCLQLLITGGEPLLRPDFSTIYQHAVKNGLLVRVFTNGTIISEANLKVLSQFRPLNIEITLYGATEATYEKITGAQGSYRQCLRGIEKILAHQLPLSLKTMLLTLNLNEFAAMKQMAKSFGLNFRYDYLVQPGCDRCKDPLALRISAEVAAALDFSDAKKKQNAKEMFAQDQGKIAADKIYNCGMGMHNFHIDPYGYLMGCIVAKHYKYDLLAGSFNQAWNNFFTPIHEKKVTSTYKCASCAISSLCLPCPGFRYLENGTELESCDYLCKIAQQKNKILSEECT